MLISTLTSYRMEILFIVLFAYMRRVRENKLKKTLESTALKAGDALPLAKVAEMAKHSVPAIVK